MTSPSSLATAEIASLDGHVAPVAETVVPATDEGFLRGDGAFEVLRVYRGRAFALADHLDRLERSAGNLRLLAVPRAELEREAVALLTERGGAEWDGCLRIVLTRGGRRLLLTEPLIQRVARLRLGFVTYAPSRVLDGVKSLSYAGNMLASRLARERGFDEALLVTPHGRVLEAPTSSIFWVGRDGVLCTTPLAEHILESITRGRVMGLVEVEERAIGTAELLGAAEAFLASTTREVQPLGGIEDCVFEEPGPRTLEAAERLREQIAAELAAT